MVCGRARIEVGSLWVGKKPLNYLFGVWRPCAHRLHISHRPTWNGFSPLDFRSISKCEKSLAAVRGETHLQSFFRKMNAKYSAWRALLCKLRCLLLCMFEYLLRTNKPFER